MLHKETKFAAIMFIVVLLIPSLYMISLHGDMHMDRYLHDTGILEQWYTYISWGTVLQLFAAMIGFVSFILFMIEAEMNEKERVKS